jgi:hypothetical protein
MLWVATLSVDVLYAAVPPDKALVPSVTAPSMNVTVPVAADGVTVAVNVTGLPYVDGLADDVTLVDDDVLFTVCDRTDDVDPVKFVSPP